MRQSRESRAPPRPAQSVVRLRTVAVLRTYLALDGRAQLRASRNTDARASAIVERRDPCSVALYRRLYRDVGATWHWHDRNAWSDDKLAARLAQPNVGVWEMTVDGVSAGYFELEVRDGSAEIVYFGLMQKFIGRGLGGLLLTRAVEEAWAMYATRVWLHTCTLDSPNALPSYKARGFREFGTQRLEVDLDGDAVVAERVLDPAPSR